MSSPMQWLCGTALGLVVGAFLDASVGKLIFVKKDGEAPLVHPASRTPSAQARRCSCSYCTCCKACKKKENP